MMLSTLLKGLTVSGKEPVLAVQGICLHSASVRSGDVFFACGGSQPHRLAYMQEAIGRGAAAIIVEDCAALSVLQESFANTPIVSVAALRQNLSLIAARFYRTVGTKLAIVGITGTNGKTSCCHFLAQAYHIWQRSCFVVGTLGQGLYPLLAKANLTTPNAFELQYLLQHALRQNATALFMEVSSHALAQYRAEAVVFKVAVLTNLSRDHLDYHGDMENYFSAKRRLFKMHGLTHAVLNIDDPAGVELAQQLQSASIRVLRYGMRGDGSADLSAQIERRDRDGMHLRISSAWGSDQLSWQVMGDFNVSNLLAVMASLICLGWSWAKVLESMAQLRSVPGRFEKMGGGVLPLVVVDYAHTPDALEKALSALLAYRGEKGHSICVFGCGGNRDQGKRRLMGQVAARYADQIVLTDDNPRDEDSGSILRDILQGIADRGKVHVEADRAKAIHYALQQAQANDVILIAGKGHEEYQIVGAQRLRFSDQKQVQRCLREWAA